MEHETIGRVCDSVRKELESRDLNRYINSILTAYVFRQPPDYEAGLGLLLRIRGASPASGIKRGLMRAKLRPESAPHLVEEAVKYIIFLVDANALFDLALGMYDFSLVLMIAQHAQKVIRPVDVMQSDWIADRPAGPERVSPIPSGAEVTGDELPKV